MNYRLFTCGFLVYLGPHCLRSIHSHAPAACNSTPLLKAEDVVQAIADHAFVASEYPLVISIEQHCCALQRVRQGQIMEELLGEQLLRPPWDEQR